MNPGAVVAGVRRGLPAYALAVIFWLISLPAVRDMESLTRGLAWIALALGLLITIATVLRAPVTTSGEADQT